MKLPEIETGDLQVKDSWDPSGTWVKSTWFI